MAQHIPLRPSHKQNQGEVSPAKEAQKLKKQLSDKNFELKKMEEDHAQKQAYLLFQFNQEKAKLNSLIKELKQKTAEENEYWARKIDEIRKQNLQLLKQNNLEWRHKVDHQVDIKMKDTKARYEHQISELKKNIQTLGDILKANEKVHEKTLNKLHQQHRRAIHELRQSKDHQYQEMRKKMIRDEQVKINALMFMRNNEEKQHMNTKNTYTKKSKEQSQKIKSLQQSILLLKQQVWNLRRQNQNLVIKSKEQVEQINKFEEQNKSHIKMTTKQYEQKIEKVEERWKQTINNLNQKWKNEFHKIYTAYQKVINACNEKQKLWEERGNKILTLYEKREAREEDTKLIQQLEVQLMRKQFELQREKQSLKTAKLQLDNMDDVYRRIFHSAQKNSRNRYSFHVKKIKLPGIVNVKLPISARHMDFC